MGRWTSKDSIGERGGVNLYGFVMNNAISYVDYLGMKEISVNKCQAYLYVGHSIGEDIKWDFPAGSCSKGGAIVCHPERNNNVPSHPDDDGDPEYRNHQWPNLPQHDNNLYLPEKDQEGNKIPNTGWNNDEQIWKRNNENKVNYGKEASGEHDFDQAVRNATNGNSLRKIMDDLCKCCKEIKVTIHLEDSTQTKNSDTRFGLNSGDNEFTFKCRSKP